MNKKTIIAPEAKIQNQRVEVSANQKPKIDVDENSPAHQAALRRCEIRNKFVTLADQVAESTFYYRNYKFKDADTLFPYMMPGAVVPTHPDMRIVTKCYPFAKGGILLVDEPRTEPEMLRAYEKQRILKKLGFRHIVIEADSNLDHLLEQLGEF